MPRASSLLAPVAAGLYSRPTCASLTHRSTVHTCSPVLSLGWSNVLWIYLYNSWSLPCLYDTHFTLKESQWPKLVSGSGLTMGSVRCPWKVIHLRRWESVILLARSQKSFSPLSCRLNVFSSSLSRWAKSRNQLSMLQLSPAPNSTVSHSWRKSPVSANIKCTM